MHFYSERRHINGFVILCMIQYFGPNVQWSANTTFVCVRVCVYLLQVSDGVEVNVLQQILSRENPLAKREEKQQVVVSHPSLWQCLNVAVTCMCVCVCARECVQTFTNTLARKLFGIYSNKRWKRRKKQCKGLDLVGHGPRCPLWNVNTPFLFRKKWCVFFFLFGVFLGGFFGTGKSKHKIA